jgi:hypothetical protein
MLWWLSKSYVFISDLDRLGQHQCHQPHSLHPLRGHLGLLPANENSLCPMVTVLWRWKVEYQEKNKDRKDGVNKGDQNKKEELNFSENYAVII